MGGSMKLQDLLDFIPIDLFTRKPPEYREFCRLLEKVGFGKDQGMEKDTYRMGRCEFVLGDTVKKIYGDTEEEMSYLDAIMEIRKYIELNSLLEERFVQEPSEPGTKRFIHDKWSILLDGELRVNYSGEREEYRFTYANAIPFVERLKKPLQDEINEDSESSFPSPGE